MGADVKALVQPLTFPCFEPGDRGWATQTRLIEALCVQIGTFGFAIPNPIDCFFPNSIVWESLHNEINALKTAPKELVTATLKQTFLRKLGNCLRQVLKPTLPDRLVV